MENKRKLQPVGEFVLTGNDMRVSDPGYDKDTWCAKVVDNCKTGKWIAENNINRYEYSNDHSDRRVASLFVRHESTPQKVFGNIHLLYDDPQDDDSACRFIFRGAWNRLSSNIGVDSGQAGFFDDAMYGNNDQFEEMGRCGYGDKWYSNCCDQTLGRYAGIVANCGVNSSSGFGDDVYYLYGHKNKDGQIDAMVLFFLPDNEKIEM